MFKIHECEICHKELSAEWVGANFPIVDFHYFCLEHKFLYMKAKSTVRIEWDKKLGKFTVEVRDAFDISNFRTNTP